MMPFVMGYSFVSKVKETTEKANEREEDIINNDFRQVTARI
jgi:hypothetical protein